MVSDATFRQWTQSSESAVKELLKPVTISEYNHTEYYVGVQGD